MICFIPQRMEFPFPAQDLDISFGFMDDLRCQVRITRLCRGVCVWWVGVPDPLLPTNFRIKIRKPNARLQKGISFDISNTLFRVCFVILCSSISTMLTWKGPRDYKRCLYDIKNTACLADTHPTSLGKIEFSSVL